MSVPVLVYTDVTFTNLVTTLVPNTNYDIFCDLTTVPITQNHYSIYWFVLSNDSTNVGNGVIIGQTGPTSSNPTAQWDDYANHQTAVYSGKWLTECQFYYPNNSTTDMHDGNSFNPNLQPIYLSVYATNASYSNVTLISSQQINVPPCFKEGSKILTDKGYFPIQDLRKGDLVKTLSEGYKAIEMIGKRDMYHQCSTDRIKEQLYKCSNDQYPEIFEDLVLTGCHSILVDSFVSQEQKEKTIEVNGDTYVTENKYRLPACADDRAAIYETEGTYTIYHLALENDNYYYNYGVFANGLLVETCSRRYLKELSGMTLIE